MRWQLRERLTRGVQIDPHAVEWSRRSRLPAESSASAELCRPFDRERLCAAILSHLVPRFSTSLIGQGAAIRARGVDPAHYEGRWSP